MWRENFFRVLYLFTQPFHRAICSVKDNHQRSFITISIVAIAITAIISIQIVLGGFADYMLDSFNSFGINQLELTSNHDVDGVNSSPFSKVESEKIKTLLADKYSIGTFCHLSQFVSLKGGGKVSEPLFSLCAADCNYLNMNGLSLSCGAPFTHRNQEEPIALIGESVVSELFGEREPIGESITIGKSDYTISGILKDELLTSKLALPNLVIVPIAQLPNIPITQPLDYALTFAADGDIDEISSEVERAALQIRGAKTLQESGLQIVKGNAVSDSIIDLTGRISWTSMVIAIILLFGSMISLINIILVSFREKSREIWVERAIGATRLAVIMEFLCESLILAQLGTLVGIILGMISGFVISSHLEINFLIPWEWVGRVIVISLIISVISGLMPILKEDRI